MDTFVIHTRPLPRSFPHPLAVSSIGYIRRKTEWHDQAFGTLNFSFILNGAGSYRIDGGEWKVRAPFVITQWPGLHVKYGPSGWWEELYITYEASLQPALEQRRLANRDRPAWPIGEAARFRRKLEELTDLLKDVGAYGRADEIDRACEGLVLESLISRPRRSAGRHESAMRAIIDYARTNYRDAMDFDALALWHGLSPSTFRRQWAKTMRIPPARFVTHLRMQKACRLLAETALGVGQIGAEVGYEDALYFSRLFRKTIGVTASEYRRRHRAPGQAE